VKVVLDRAEATGIKVMLTVFSLPGCRWKQQNNDEFDYRLWNEEDFQKQASQFWSDVAKALRGHPALVGYNPLNEPHPEREAGIEEPGEAYEEWVAKNQGTAADLDQFNRSMVKAIRSVDPRMPVILDGRFHGNAAGLSTLKPLEDEKVLYAFHFYEPWNFNTFRVNKGRFSYPDKMPKGWSGETTTWTREHLAQRMKPAWNWAEKHAIPQRRIIVSELGCDRRVGGAAPYLRDVIGILDEKKVHWAFYSFRSRNWDGMDYELGTEKLDWKYWQEREAGKSHEELVKRVDNPLWKVIRDSLKAF